jgi:hypothetical protein
MGRGRRGGTDATLEPCPVAEALAQLRPDYREVPVETETYYRVVRRTTRAVTEPTHAAVLQLARGP